MTHHSDHDAHRAFEDTAAQQERHKAQVLRLRPHVGCTSACEWGQPCECSHRNAWRAPRQPRKSSHRMPGLGLLTRLRLFLTRLRASR